MEQTNLKELQKKEAINRLKLLIERGLFDETLNFFKNGETAIYENLGGCPILYGLEMNQPQENYLNAKIAKEEFEESHNALVYMMSCTHTTFGTCYEMYYVSQYQQEWESEVEELMNGNVYCYVYNSDIPHYSESGYINFKINQAFGGVVRVNLGE